MNKDKDKKIDNHIKKYNVKIMTVSIILTVLIFIFFLLVLFNYIKVSKYKDTILPNTYVSTYNVGNYKYDEVEDFINFLNNVVNDKKIKINVNDKDLIYTFKDFGIVLDSKTIKEDIINDQKDLTFSEKISYIYGKKKVYNYKFSYNEENVDSFVDRLVEKVNSDKIDGHFTDEGGNVRYLMGTNGYHLKVDEAKNKIKEEFKKGSFDDISIKLDGDVDVVENNDLLATVNTKVSEFTTEFNQWQGTRPQNLYTALNYINGAVIMPGEEFSYYKYAGPFNKAGYVFYYEFVGNGVCQIATTVYDAALLGGLEITKRYPHAKKSVYVAGGLDATVASYSSGWYVDFAFRNTYEYPIYIRAYAWNGHATVELWSNSDAKKGYTYETESVQIGARGYDTYLHVYKDGEYVERRYIDRTWYIED